MPSGTTQKPVQQSAGPLFSPRWAGFLQLGESADTGYLNSNGFKSISVFGGMGSSRLGSLAEVSLNNNATGEAVEVVRIPLHHRFSLRQVLGLVVDAGNARLFV